MTLESPHIVADAQKTLEGEQDSIKEYSIAFDVCGRDSSFDPKIDPIVRVDAKPRGYFRSDRRGFMMTLERKAIIMSYINARLARRDDQEYREYLREKQRRQPGYPARKMATYF